MGFFSHLFSSPPVELPCPCDKMDMDLINSGVGAEAVDGRSHIDFHFSLTCTSCKRVRYSTIRITITTSYTIPFNGIAQF